MKNTFGIIGAILFAIAVAVGYFCKFDAAGIIEIALAAFGLATIVISAIKKAKAEGNFSWKTIVVIVAAVIGGALCAVGGYESSIFKVIAGAVVAILAVIFSVVDSKITAK